MVINVLEYLEGSARRYPDKVAFEDKKSSLTFKELLSISKAVGSRISVNNLIHSPIIVLMEKSADSIAGFMGVLYSGNFYCPLDTHMPEARIKVIIDTLNPIAILSDLANKKKVEKLQFKGEIIIYEEAKQKNVTNDKLSLIRKKILDTDPAYVLFTSGSTGVPKGVLINHRSIIDFTDWMCEKFHIESRDSFGNQSPFFFDLSIGDLYCTLKMGCTNYIIPKELFTFPVDLLKFLNEKKINIIFWVPSALCIVANLRALSKVKLEWIDRVLFCGEVMPNKQLNIWRKSLPNAMFANLYGPCEATDASTYYIVDREFADDDPLPIGVPCENTDILVLNEDNTIVKKDEIGELCIRGSGLAMGYYNDPERTKAAFVQNPLNLSYPEIIYRTGDLVKYNEYGELMYVSRKDFQIKHMGHRVELGEIETAVSSIKGIETGVCLHDNAKDQIVLFLIGEDIKDKEVKEILRTKLQEYMIPNRIIHLDELPYNANGKINRKKLKEKLKES